MRKRYVAAYICIALVGLAFAMSYLVRTRTPSLELVTGQQELPDPKAHYSLESGLSERVSKSYGLALVLVISEYSRNNAVALEAIRSWAHQKFQRDRDFLHTLETSTVSASHNSVIDALCYSLLTPPRFLLETEALLMLQHQIAVFHSTKAFQAFRADYFDSFGLDHESANLLARYQCERAKPAVGILLLVAYWLVAGILGFALHFRRHNEVRSTRWQRSLSFFWFALSLFYIIVSWVQNDVSELVSSIFCVLLGLYLRRPIAIAFGEDKGLSLKLLVPSVPVLAGATWVTVTLVGIQALTWIHTGSMTQADPVSLMVSSITGDFVHDHANAKRYVTRITGVIWLLATVWGLWVSMHATRSFENVEGLTAINDPL
jgi:hypothetical protein